MKLILNTESRRKLKFRLDRLRWLSDKTAFITVAAVDDDGNVTQYLIHWNWPLSGQKCRIDANTGEIIEFSKQDPFGIKIYQTTDEQSLEPDFSLAIKERLKYLKDHVDGLHKDASSSKPLDQEYS